MTVKCWLCQVSWNEETAVIAALQDLYKAKFLGVCIRHHDNEKLSARITNPADTLRRKEE